MYDFSLVWGILIVTWLPEWPMLLYRKLIISCVVFLLLSFSLFPSFRFFFYILSFLLLYPSIAIFLSLINEDFVQPVCLSVSSMCLFQFVSLSIWLFVCSVTLIMRNESMT